MKRYIISGLNGNIGSLLKERLSNYVEYKIDLKPNIKNENIFIHLASKSEGSYKEIINSNINYLCEIIDFCKENNISKFIFFSAASIYNKDDLYSNSKLFGEKLLEESGLNVLVIRLPMVLTQNSTNGILNRILNTLEENKSLILFNAYKPFNNFISVDEIFNFIKNYNFKKKYELINLASSNENSLYEIVMILKNLIKSHSEITINEDSQTFEISTTKAEKNYNFLPIKNEIKLNQWIKIRNKGQK